MNLISYSYRPTDDKRNALSRRPTGKLASGYSNYEPLAAGRHHDRQLDNGVGNDHDDHDHDEGGAGLFGKFLLAGGDQAEARRRDGATDASGEFQLMSRSSSGRFRQQQQQQQREQRAPTAAYQNGCATSGGRLPASGEPNEQLRAARAQPTSSWQTLASCAANNKRAPAWQLEQAGGELDARHSSSMAARSQVSQEQEFADSAGLYSHPSSQQGAQIDKQQANSNQICSQTQQAQQPSSLTTSNRSTATATNSSSLTDDQSTGGSQPESAGEPAGWRQRQRRPDDHSLEMERRRHELSQAEGENENKCHLERGQEDEQHFYCAVSAASLAPEGGQLALHEQLCGPPTFIGRQHQQQQQQHLFAASLRRPYSIYKSPAHLNLDHSYQTLVEKLNEKAGGMGGAPLYQPNIYTQLPLGPPMATQNFYSNHVAAEQNRSNQLIGPLIERRDDGFRQVSGASPVFSSPSRPLHNYSSSSSDNFQQLAPNSASLHKRQQQHQQHYLMCAAGAGAKALRGPAHHPGLARLGHAQRQLKWAMGGRGGLCCRWRLGALAMLICALLLAAALLLLLYLTGARHLLTGSAKGE